jgi:hypothetical protein
MLLLAAMSALLFAALVGSISAWWLSGGRLRRSRQASRLGLDAQAALWRHPAGRGRWPQLGGTPPEPWDGPVPGRTVVGPDDDPEFISALERLIRGDRGEPG